ncbi:glutaredoxin domain-containing cysteine-rich protein CG12206 isoform X2 [Aedes albopictus]|uniref:Uncharacterized protein n=1 Tax=Aedes albopictus TaxID=7160 RepID=A0ABM2A4E0_AEDAL
MDSTASLHHRLTSIQISAETTVYTSLDSSLAALQNASQRMHEDQVDGASSLPPAVELLLSAAAVPAASVYVSATEPSAEKLVSQRESLEKEERAEAFPLRSSAGAGAVALGNPSSGSSLLGSVQEKPSSPCSPPPPLSLPVVTDQESHVVRIQIVQSKCSSPINGVGNISVTNLNSSSAASVVNQCKSKVSIVSFGPPDQCSQSPSPTPSVEMVQKQSSPSASPTNGAKSDLVDVNNATYLYYMMSSGQCSPSDTLDSGTCSDIEVTPPPLPKKMSPKSPSPPKHPAAQHATLMMISPTPSDKLNQPGGGYRSSNYTTSDSDESESSLSCDSLNFSQLCGNVSVLGPVSDSLSVVTTNPQTPEPLSTAATPTSDSDRENVIPECPQMPQIIPIKHKIVSILPDSLLKDIRERSSTGSAAREVPSPSPPREESTPVGMTTTRSILMEKINSLNSVANSAGSISSLSEKNKSISFENDKFYKFHINEHSTLQQQQQQQQSPNQQNGSVHLNGAGNHSCSSSVIDDDESFAGFKDLTSGTSTIRSNKGTVRGVKNRVRNGIATFLQMQQANIKVTENNKLTRGYKYWQVHISRNVWYLNKSTAIKYIPEKKKQTPKHKHWRNFAKKLISSIYSRRYS